MAKLLDIPELMAQIDKYDTEDLAALADAREEEARILRGIMDSRVLPTKRIKAKSNGNGHTKPIEAKRRKTSAKVKSARVLHGQLMGLSRGLNDTQKAHVKSVRAQKGVRQAIKVAKNIRKQFVAEA